MPQNQSLFLHRYPSELPWRSPLVRGVSAGKGRSPLYLLTNEPLETVDDAWQIAFFYMRVLKSEVGVVSPFPVVRHAPILPAGSGLISPQFMVAWSFLRLRPRHIHRAYCARSRKKVRLLSRQSSPPAQLAKSRPASAKTNTCPPASP